MQQYYQGTDNKSEHRGNFHIKNGIEISETVAMSVIDATAHAMAMRQATGNPANFEDAKKIAKAALFGASIAESNVEYINGKVREQRKAPQDDGRGLQQRADDYRQQSQGTGYFGSPYNR